MKQSWQNWKRRQGSSGAKNILLNVTTNGTTIIMKYEWDENKRQQNLIKHGLDFADAWQLFENPMVVWPDSRFEYDEDRWIGIGIMLTAVVAILAFTERDPDIVRIISLRKAMKHEKEKYEHTVRN